jgi:hypothetical protein
MGRIWRREGLAGINKGINAVALRRIIRGMQLSIPNIITKINI